MFYSREHAALLLLPSNKNWSAGVAFYIWRSRSGGFKGWSGGLEGQSFGMEGQSGGLEGWSGWLEGWYGWLKRWSEGQCVGLKCRNVGSLHLQCPGLHKTRAVSMGNARRQNESE